MYQIIIYMNLGFKFLLYLNGKRFAKKKNAFIRYNSVFLSNWYLYDMFNCTSSLVNFFIV